MTAVLTVAFVHKVIAGRGQIISKVQATMVQTPGSPWLVDMVDAVKGL